MKGDGNVKATRKVACRTGSKVEVAPCYERIVKPKDTVFIAASGIVRVFTGVKLSK